MKPVNKMFAQVTLSLLLHEKYLCGKSILAVSYPEVASEFSVEKDVLGRAP